MTQDLYKILGIGPQASINEIKTAYRKLVKQHHPDAGGDQETILALNAAWEILGDKEQRLAYDLDNKSISSLAKEARKRSERNAYASAAVKQAQGQSAAAELDLLKWLNEVYTPIDRLLGQVIRPFAAQVKNLSADPYDDELMEEFCSYLKQSQKKLEKIEQIFRSRQTPSSAKEFGLSLYHCLFQVQDAFNEIERYTMGYVDSYLHDGREMLQVAKQRRLRLKKERLRLKIS